MLDEKYVLDCPSCGRIEGYVPSAGRLGDDPSEPDDADNLIESQVVQTITGPTTRLRCPKCGTWVEGDRGWPA